MSMNLVVVNGRLPRFEGTYRKGEGDKKSFLTWCISVKRDFKPEGAQYYPEDLLKFKAFGARADFIMNNFAQGDGLIITGKLQVEEDYQDKDGNTVKGQMCIMVETANFADAKASNGTAGAGTPGAAAPAPRAGVPAGKPGVPGAKPGVPGAKPGVPGAKPNFGRPTPPSFKK